MTSIAERDPAPDTTRPETNRWLVLVLVCLAQFMVVLTPRSPTSRCHRSSATSASRPPTSSGSSTATP